MDIFNPRKDKVQAYSLLPLSPARPTRDQQKRLESSKYASSVIHWVSLLNNEGNADQDSGGNYARMPLNPQWRDTLN